MFFVILINIYKKRGSFLFTCHVFYLNYIEPQSSLIFYATRRSVFVTESCGTFFMSLVD